MNNSKNRKIQSIWSDSQSYKNYITQLEAEQNKIDKDRKKTPDNFIKRIYSMDSGLITPILFISKWIERFFVTPIGDIVNLSDTYTGQGSEVLVDDKFFTGDRGQWLEDVSVVIGTVRYGSYDPPPPYIGGDTDGYATVVNHIYIGTNDTISNLLHINISGEAYCSTWHSSSPPPFGISRADQRTITVTNGQIYFDGNINKVLKSTSVINMTSSATLSSLTNCGISCRITFGSGRDLEFAYGKQGHSGCITISNFTNFTRNIGDDYIAEWGSIPVGETIQSIYFFVNFGIAGTNGITNSANMTVSITNISVTNI